MSDSDCSNCDKDDCKFNDYSYNCYVNKIKDAKKVFNRIFIQELRSKIFDINMVEDQATYLDDEIRNLKLAIKDIINLYEEEI
jgi:hypothetical protein